MIYVGYQGVGKSTLAGKKNCIDLESSNFTIDGKKPKGWEKIYCNIAEDLSRQGYRVFLSCHKSVREELINKGDEFDIIYPSLDLKEEWIARLKKRYENTGLEKDLKAYERARDYYEEDIKDIESDNPGDSSIGFTEITSTEYDIEKDLLEGLIDFEKYMPKGEGKNENEKES